MFEGPEGRSRNMYIYITLQLNICLTIRVKPSVTVLKPAVIRTI
jgi:hypothetical protein